MGRGLERKISVGKGEHREEKMTKIQCVLERALEGEVAQICVYMYKATGNKTMKKLKPFNIKSKDIVNILRIKHNYIYNSSSP